MKRKHNPAIALGAFEAFKKLISKNGDLTFRHTVQK